MRRDGLWAAFISVLLLFGLSMLLVFSYRAQVVQLKGDIYRQCVARADYDASSQHVRAVSRDYWLGVIDDERHNRFIDDNLRAKRVAGAQAMIDAINDTLSKSVRGGCQQYAH